MSQLCLVDDVLELNGRPVATLIPGVRLSTRDELIRTFDSLDEVHELGDDVTELEDRIEQLEARLAPKVQS